MRPRSPEWRGLKQCLVPPSPEGRDHSSRGRKAAVTSLNGIQVVRGLKRIATSRQIPATAGLVPAGRCSSPARAPRPFPPPLGLSQRGAAPRQPVRRAHSRHRWACPASSQRGAAPRQPVRRAHSRHRWAFRLVPAGRCSSPARAPCPFPPPLGLSQRGDAPRQPVRRAHSRHRWACPSGAMLLARDVRCAAAARR